MQNFSIYTSSTLSYKEVIETIQTSGTWKPQDADPITGTPLTFQLDILGSFKEKIHEQEFQFAFIELFQEKVSAKYSQDHDREKRINKNELKFLIFPFGSELKIIAYKGKSNKTLSGLRAALNSPPKNTLCEEKLKIDEDFLYWIFDKNINNKGTEFFKGSKLYVDNLIGYSGETNDTQNKIIGDGNRIVEILWTLAFLFTNESLKSIQPFLRYDKNGIGVELTLNGTYKIDFSTHKGLWETESNIHKKQGILMIYFYTILFPSFEKIYTKQKSLGLWSEQVKLHFVKSIGNEIQNQVNIKLADIEEKLNLNSESEPDSDEN